MQFSYPNNEKLKSHKTIERLFSEGKSISKYPLRLVFVENTDENNLEKVLMGVSVSKKYFKRVLRECYRLNQNLLKDNLQKPYAFMFFYQTKEKLSYQEIEEKTIQLFQKFRETIK